MQAIELLDVANMDNAKIIKDIDRLSDTADSLIFFIISILDEEMIHDSVDKVSDLCKPRKKKVKGPTVVYYTGMKKDNSPETIAEKRQAKLRYQKRKKEYKRKIKSIEMQFDEIKKDLRIRKKAKLFPEWFRDLSTIWSLSYETYYICSGYDYDDYIEGCDFSVRAVFKQVEILKEYIRQLKKYAKISKNIKDVKHYPVITFHEYGIGTVNGQRFRFRKNSPNYNLFFALYERINEEIPRDEAIKLAGIDGSSLKITQTIELNDRIKKLRRATGLGEYLVLNVGVTLKGIKG